MSENTNTPLTDSINALTAYANEVTGGSDTTLSDAVHTLANGYGGGSGAWKQKQVTVENAISLGGGFGDLISSNLPSGKTFCIIVKENRSTTSLINNQLIEGTYDTVNSSLNSIARYRNNGYAFVAGAGYNVWTDTYALTASVGDIYTLFYQD